MTATTSTIAELLEAVHADPSDLNVRLVLADALADVGELREEGFWRWTVEHKLVPSYDDQGEYIWTWFDLSRITNDAPLWAAFNGHAPELTYRNSQTAEDAFDRMRPVHEAMR